MRVVHVVCSDGFGGVERYISNLSTGLARAGVDVHVIGGSVERMRAPLISAGVTWHRGDSPRQAYAALRRLPVPDIVNTHMTQADLVGRIYRWSGGRLAAQVSTRHFAAPRGTRWPGRLAARLIGAGMQAQLSISEFVAAEVDGPSSIVYSGVADRSDTREREQTVLVAQRFEREKDTATAVRAWAAAGARERGWTLLLAGDGSEASRLRALVDDLGVGGSVRFLGFRSDVDAWVARAGIVLAPTPREGLGILVLEAMASGAPVVAAAGGGHLESIGRVDDRLLFPPGDAMAAAAVIDALAADPVERASVGRRLRARQRAVFTTAAQVEGTVDLYRRVLAGEMRHD